jgi:hypothetical protein
MKAGIVKLSTLAKYGRWDAAFYLPTEDRAKVEAAELRAKQAAERVELVRAEESAKVARGQAMIDNGEVTPLE